MYALEVHDLWKAYSTKNEAVQALRGVSFKVRKGEIFGFLGPNGAGKTTTINILTGLLTADSGSIRFFGKEPCEETRNKINAATAYKSLNGMLTVRQNLKVYAKLYGVKEYSSRIEDLLQRFEIQHLGNRRVWDLSSGQKTRVNLCKALINKPDLVFLDEATAGLDPHIAQRVRKQIKELDTTVIFTSHLMNEVEELCNRIAFLKEGRILKVGTPAQLKGLLRKSVFIIEFLKKPKGAAAILKSLHPIAQSAYKVMVELRTPHEMHHVIHTLIMNKFVIRDFHIQKPTLEELFIKVAEGGI